MRMALRGRRIPDDLVYKKKLIKQAQELAECTEEAWLEVVP